MSCCGNQRSSIRQESPVRHSVTASPSSASGHWTPGATHFEYTGHGQLTVTGPLTGQVYRFIGPGARVLIHGADASSLILVPGLRTAR
jgi:hypothetical protein